MASLLVFTIITYTWDTCKHVMHEVSNDLNKNSEKQIEPVANFQIWSMIIPRAKAANFQMAKGLFELGVGQQLSLHGYWPTAN